MWLKKIGKFRYKILLVVSVAAALPLLILSILVQYEFDQIVREKYTTSASDSLELINWNIHSMMTDIMNISDVLITSESIQDYLTKYNPKDNNYEQYHNRVQCEKLLINFTNNKKYISAIYMGNEKTEISQYSKEFPSEKFSYLSLENTTLYQKIDAAQGAGVWLTGEKLHFSDDNLLLYARKVKNLYMLDGIGVMLIGIDKSIFQEMFSSIPENYLILQDDELLFGQFVDFEKLENLKIQEILRALDNEKRIITIENEKFDISQVENKETSWRIVSLHKDSLLTNEIRKLQRIVIIVTLLVLTIILMTTALVIHKITGQVSVFEELFCRLKNKQSIDMISFDEKDELGDIGKRFVDAITKNNVLQNQLFDMELKQKEAELFSLQQQINPHFLYNLFNSVFWMADSIHAENICEFSLNASQYYRMTLGNGELMVPIRQEIELIRAYMEIQKVRYSNRFDYIIECDDNILDCSIVKFILQPIVENAVCHGIEGISSGGFINISFIKMGAFINIKVKDNGIGFDIKKIPKGFALKNIEQRLKLFYGENSELSIRSVPGNGTEVDIFYKVKR